MALLGVNKQDLQRLLAVQNTNGNVFNESDTYIIDGLYYNYVASSNSLVEVEPPGPFAVRFNPQTGLYEAAGYDAPLGDFNQYTGWVDHVDGEYSDGSPWNPTTGQWNDVPNDAAVVLDGQKPVDISGDLYDLVTGLIAGRNGDGLTLTVEWAARPTTSTTTFLDTAFFIGNNLGPLGDGRIYQRTHTFPKGQNQIRVLSFTVGGYTLDTWEANGAKFQMNPNAAVDIWAVRYLLKRDHKARATS